MRMQTNNRKMQINSFQKSTAPAIGHLSILGCNVFRKVWQYWKVMSLWRRCRKYPRQNGNLEEWLKKVNSSRKKKKRLYTGFVKTAVNTNRSLSKNVTDGSDLQ